jgi:hypothetical protein
VRKVLRALTVAAAAALATVGAVPTAHAATPVFTVWDGTGAEYYWNCSGTAPYTCTKHSSFMGVQVTVSNAPRNVPITVGYRVEGITATAGADFTGTTGTITMPAGWFVGWIYIPVVDDAVPEPTETVRVRLTSSSVGGNISDTGIASILNDGSIPRDCTPFRPDGQSYGWTCTNRPPTERWQIEVECGEDWPMFVYVRGNIVTGNGTATATCAGTGLPFVHGWRIVL